LREASVKAIHIVIYVELFHDHQNAGKDVIVVTLWYLKTTDWIFKVFLVMAEQL